MDNDALAQSVPTARPIASVRHTVSRFYRHSE